MGETDPLSAWSSVWSLARSDADSGARLESLLTADEDEKDALLAATAAAAAAATTTAVNGGSGGVGSSGGGWSEVCAPFGGNGDFCGGQPVPSADYELDDRRGPFLLFARALPTIATAAATATTTTTTTGAGSASSAALYRCYDSAAKLHFFSKDPNCRGLASSSSPSSSSSAVAEEVAEGVLGFVSLERNSMTARSLSLCLSAEGGYYYHSLDGPCDDGDSFLEDCGFVH